MPENETLFPDARTASRWQPLRDRIARGESPDAVFPDLQEQFHRALKRVFKLWKDRGVDPKDLFEAAQNDPAVLRDLIGQTWNDEFARLLQDATAGETSPDLEGVLRCFLDSVWEQIRGHLQIDCLDGGVPDSFLNRIDQMLERMIRSLLKNPSRPPRRPTNIKPPPDIDDMLGESLPLA